MPVARVELPCERCGRSASFPAEAVGTVQECPHCGAFVDVELPEEVEEQLLNREPDEGPDPFWEEEERQQKVAAQQLERTAQLQAQAEDLLKRWAGLLERCERLADRAEVVLERSEGGGPS